MARNGYSYAPFTAQPSPGLHVSCTSISWAATLSCSGVCTIMTSSIKPEVHNVSRRRKRRTEPRPLVTSTKKLVKMGRVVPKIRSQTDKHTHRHGHHNTPFPYGRWVTIKFTKKIANTTFIISYRTVCFIYPLNEWVTESLQQRGNMMLAGLAALLTC